MKCLSTKSWNDEEEWGRMRKDEEEWGRMRIRMEGKMRKEGWGMNDGGWGGVGDGYWVVNLESRIITSFYFVYKIEVSEHKSG